MKIIIPNIEGLPKDNYLNTMINGFNNGALIDEVFTASMISGFSRFLAERPEIISGPEWINRAGGLVQGIEVNQAAAEGLYKDLIQNEKMELRQGGAAFGPHRKLMFFFLALISLVTSGIILYKIYVVYPLSGEVVPGDILLFVAPFALAILFGIMGYKAPRHKQVPGTNLPE